MEKVFEILDSSFDDNFFRIPYKEDSHSFYESVLDTDCSSLILNLEINDCFALENFECLESKPEPHKRPELVGTLSYEKRKEKVKRYLEKKHQRTYKKKINYSCRKMVADQRVRYKGRFVTKDQAEALKSLSLIN